MNSFVGHRSWFCCRLLLLSFIAALFNHWFRPLIPTYSWLFRPVNRLFQYSSTHLLLFFLFIRHCVIYGWTHRQPNQSSESLGQLWHVSCIGATWTTFEVQSYTESSDTSAVGSAVARAGEKTQPSVGREGWAEWAGCAGWLGLLFPIPQILVTVQWSAAWSTRIWRRLLPRTSRSPWCTLLCGILLTFSKSCSSSSAHKITSE